MIETKKIWYSSLLLFVIFGLLQFLSCKKMKSENDFLNKTGDLQKPKITTIIDIDTVTKIDTISMEMIWYNDFGKKVKCSNQPKDIEQTISTIYSIQEGPDYSILILDKNKILKLSKDGKWLNNIGEMGSGPGEFINPQFMRYSNDKIFIADPSNGRIEVLDSEGKYLRQIDRNKIGNLRFQFAVGPNDEIIARTKDMDSDLLMILDSLGNVVKKFGNYIPYGFNHIQQMHFNNMYIFFDKINENIFCVFENFPIIRRYSLTGDFLEEIRLEGKRELKYFSELFEQSLRINKDHANKNDLIVTSNPFMGLASYDEKGKIVLSTFFRAKPCIFIIDVSKNVANIESIAFYKCDDIKNEPMPHNTFFVNGLLYSYSPNNSLFKQKNKE